MTSKTAAALKAQIHSADPFDMFEDIADTVGNNKPIGPLGASFAIATEADNEIVVTVTLQDVDGTTMAVASAVRVYLSDLATGLAITATAPNTSGACDNELAEPLAKAQWIALSSAAGVITVTLGETSTGTWYVVVVLADGTLAVSGAVTFT